MSPDQLMSVTREAFWVILKMCIAPLLIALTVGFTIALFQALTQMQEMTISFVPKMVAMYLSLIVLLPLMGGALISFTDHLVALMILAPSQ